MAADPSIGRVVVYRSRTGFDVPAIIAATQDSLFEPGVRAYRESGGTRGVPPLSSPDNVHLVVFSPGLPQEPSPRWGEAASGGRVHLHEEDCAASRGAVLIDENMGGTFREWNVPLWEPMMMHSPQPGVMSTPAEPDLGSWRWPTIR
jgi:hypothetical protein